MSGMTSKTVGDAIYEMVKRPEFWGPVAATTLGFGANAAHRALSRSQEAQQKARTYNEMLALHPSLKEMDPKRVQRTYNSLHNVNPMLARDPSVAGGWVINVLEADSYSGDNNQALIAAVKDLAGIRSQMSQAIEREHKMRPQIGAHVERFGTTAVNAYSAAQKAMNEAPLADIAAREKELAEARGKWREDIGRTEKGIHVDRKSLELARREHEARVREWEEAHGQRKFSSAAGQRLLAAIR